MKAFIAFESQARVSNVKWLYDTLEKYGLPQKSVASGCVVLDEIADVKKKHITQYRDQFEKQLEGGGRVVLLIGNTPLQAVTGKAGIKQKRGRPFEQDGNLYLPTFSPGTILYDENVKPLIEADLRLFVEMVKKGRIPREEGLNHTIVRHRREFDAMLRDLVGTVSFDTETNGLYPWAEGAAIQSIGFGTRTRQWCLPLNHPEAVTFGLTQHEMMRQIAEKLESCQLVAHNGKFDSLWIRVCYGLDIRCEFDTMLAHYIVDENSRHGLKGLAQVFFGAPNYDVDSNLKQGVGPLEQHCLYLAHDVYYTRKLRFKLGKLIDEDDGTKQVFEHILMPCATAFVDVEFHGVFINLKKMGEVDEYLKGKRAAALKLLEKYSTEINWRSPKQLVEFFFTKLKLKPLDMTPTGSASTSESVLLRLDHPAARALLEYRAADKNLGTFIEGWRHFISGDRMHPSFKLHGAVTGRPSCEHPNLQQVPRDPMIRSLIDAPDGWTLLDFDLSQIEMRIAAELSGDTTLLAAFAADEDVHWLTAIREISRGQGMVHEIVETVRLATGTRLPYGKAVTELIKMGPDRAIELMPTWKEARKKAKAINFGYLFGMWWKKFIIYARDNYGVTVTEKQAQESRKAFFDLYKELGPWHDRQRRYARRHGHVRALSGRLRRLPAAMSQHDTPERAEAERQAINSPVQCFANELNLMTLLQLMAEFPDVARPVGTVHDAILVEVKNEWVERVANRGLEIMTRPKMLDVLGIRLRVPIKGDVKVGPWGKGIDLDKWLKNFPSRKVKSTRGGVAVKSTTSKTSRS